MTEKEAIDHLLAMPPKAVGHLMTAVLLMSESHVSPEPETSDTTSRNTEGASHE